jgi:hypothetical protein
MNPFLGSWLFHVQLPPVSPKSVNNSTHDEQQEAAVISTRTVSSQFDSIVCPMDVAKTFAYHLAYHLADM